MTPMELKADREARILELEQRRSRQTSLGVKWPMALVGMGTALFLFWQMRLDIAYFFAPTTPVSLGSEGNYQWDKLESNRLVQIHGIPTWRGAYFQESGKTYVVVGLKDTKVLVRREALSDEAWEEGETPPQPNQSPFAVRGRLLSRAEAFRYESGFETLKAMGEVDPQWIILQGERPRESLKTLLWECGLLAFFFLNAWFLLRDIASRRRA